MNRNVVIGINCAHAASVCILVDGVLEVALCEERVTGKKHQHGFPFGALQECMGHVGLDQSIVPASIVLNQIPPACHDRIIRSLFPHVNNETVRVNPSHHLLHACYAKAASGFNDAAVLIVDGSGYSYGEHIRRGSPLLGNRPHYDDMCESLSMFYVDEHDEFKLIRKKWDLWIEDREDCFRFPSLGHMYSMAAQQIFGDWVHAGKVMGLAPYGNPSRIAIDAVSIVGDDIKISTDWIDEIRNLDVWQGFANINPCASDVAASVQSQLEQAMLHIIATLRKSCPSRNLCISGGVGLNSVCNGRIVNEGLYEKVFVTPAAGDSGVAIGAAAFGHLISNGRLPHLHSRQEFLGPEYPIQRLAKAANSMAGVIPTRIEQPSIEAAKDIANGLVVGWFEGRSEFGPRALGHRSILADARDPNIKTRLNNVIKFREAFRPFAAAILAEDYDYWFELASQSPHMLLVGKVRADQRPKIPGVVHVDNSCRLQTVSNSYPGHLRDILLSFKTLTGVPLIVNTSLNIQGMPICETPEDAVTCFIHSGIDVLYLKNWRLIKCHPYESRYYACSQIPIVHDDIVVTTNVKYSSSGWSTQSIQLGLRKNIKYEASIDEYKLLRLIDGKKKIGDIANTGGWSEEETLTLLCGLHNRGVLYFVRADDDAARVNPIGDSVGSNHE